MQKTKSIFQTIEYFPKQKSIGENEKVELGLSNYATKAKLKNSKDVNTSDFPPKKINLKSDVNKLDIDKLKNVHLRNLKSK